MKNATKIIMSAVTAIDSWGAESNTVICEM